MKKMNFFKTLMTLVLAFAFSGAFAQFPATVGDYNASTTESPDYVTIDKFMPYFVHPDLNISDAYDPTVDLTANVNSTFVWDYPVAAGTVTEQNLNNNYVELSFDTPGAYTLRAEETFAACSGTPVTLSVVAVDAPTATITTGDILVPASCGPQAAEAINIRIVENVPDALAGYAFAVSEVVDNIDGVGALIGNVSTNSTFIDIPTTAKVVDGSANFTAATPDFDYDFNSSALAVQNGQRTRYTYTLLKATDAPGAAAEGIISAISEKSDYLGTVTTYAFTDNQVVFIVNPAPVTGPIYHIANDYAL